LPVAIGIEVFAWQIVQWQASHPTHKTVSTSRTSVKARRRPDLKQPASTEQGAIQNAFFIVNDGAADDRVSGSLTTSGLLWRMGHGKLPLAQTCSCYWWCRLSRLSPV
jgi:hypothetical protein